MSEQQLDYWMEAAAKCVAGDESVLVKELDAFAGIAESMATQEGRDPGLGVAFYMIRDLAHIVGVLSGAIALRDEIAQPPAAKE